MAPAVVVLLALAAALLCAAAAAFFFQRKLMYFPETVPPDEPLSGLRPGDEEVFFEASDGVRLWALFSPGPPDRPCLLLLHGNAGSLRSWKHLHFALADLGFAVLTPDYRGYGKSGGSPDEQGLYRDGRAALSYLRGRGREAGDVVLFGKSLGTGVAVQLATEVRVRGVVLESPYLSFAEVVRRVAPGLPAGAVLRDRFDSRAKIRDIRAPLLVVAGEADTLIPAAHSRTLFEEAGDPKEFFLVPGAGHNDIQLLGGRPYWDNISSWTASAPPRGEGESQVDG